MQVNHIANGKSGDGAFLRRVRRNWQLYVVISAPLLYVVLFQYAPMFGIQIAFKEYDSYSGIFNSPWVGLDNFTRFFTSYNFWRIVYNTISLSMIGLIMGLPMPIILAIALNECQMTRFKKFVQTVTYAPHFISTVVMVSMVILYLSPNSGLINNFLSTLGFDTINYMAEPKFFRLIYVVSGIWQGTGYGSIIYLAALAGIDPTLYEAATIDGAGRMRRIWHIDLPSLMPTVIIMLILSTGSMMSVGFEKAYLMQNSLNLSASEIISTYVYKLGIERADFSYSAAIGLFNSVVNTMMILLVNFIARKVSETSLF